MKTGSYHRLGSYQIMFYRDEADVRGIKVNFSLAMRESYLEFYDRDWELIMDEDLLYELQQATEEIRHDLVTERAMYNFMDFMSEGLGRC